MEIVGIVKDGKVELPATIHLPDGAQVRVILEGKPSGEDASFESEPIGEGSVLADIAWATGRHFGA